MDTRLPCCNCGVPCDEFTVPNDLWNEVIRKGGKETDQEYLCLMCFLEQYKAWAQGFDYDSALAAILKDRDYAFMVEETQAPGPRFTAQLYELDDKLEGSCGVGDGWYCNTLREVLESMEEEARKHEAAAKEASA